MGDKLHSFSFKNGFKRARKNNRYTQKTFADEFNISIETVKNWEQGRNIPEIKTLEKLCDFFQCDLDYLFNNIECKTHDVQFIQDCTGLSENSIENICTINKSNKSNEYMTALNMLLQQDYDLRRILLHINKYIKATNEYKSIHKMVLDRYNEVLSGEPMDIDGFYNWPYNDDLDKDCTASKREMSVEEYELYNTIISVIKGLAKTNVQ